MNTIQWQHLNFCTCFMLTIKIIFFAQDQYCLLRKTLKLITNNHIQTVN